MIRPLGAGISQCGVFAHSWHANVCTPHFQQAKFYFDPDGHDALQFLYTRMWPLVIPLRGLGRSNLLIYFAKLVNSLQIGENIFWLHFRHKGTTPYAHTHAHKKKSTYSKGNISIWTMLTFDKITSLAALGSTCSCFALLLTSDKSFPLFLHLAGRGSCRL